MPLTSRHLKQWVHLYLNGSDGHFKAYIKKLGFEAGKECYIVLYEDGTEECIFVDSVYRIVRANPKKGRVIDYEKRRKKFRVV